MPYQPNRFEGVWSGVGWCSAPPPLPPTSEPEVALAAVADGLDAELGEIAGDVAAIGDRQRVLDGAKAHILQGSVPVLRELVREGRGAVERAEAATSPEERAEHLARATACLSAALTLTSLQRVEVAYLQVADAAEDAGQPSPQTVGILGAMSGELRPIVEAAATLDLATLEGALSEHAAALEHARDFLPSWAAAVTRGADLSRKAVAAADAATIVLSLFEGGKVIAGALRGSAGTGGSWGGVGGVGPGGAAVLARAPAGAAVLTAEHLETLKKLVELGALGSAAVSGSPVTSTRPNNGAPTLGAVRMDTPSGKFVAEAGPLEGETVSYGDPRNKHTYIGEHTLEQIKEALRRPAKASGPLRRFAEALANGDKSRGSQLSREGVAQYEKLVRDAVEKGREDAGKYYYSADREIGFDVEKGKATKDYRVDGVPRGGHVIPEVRKKR